MAQHLIYRPARLPDLLSGGRGHAISLAQCYDAWADQWHSRIQRLGYLQTYQQVFSDLRQDPYFPKQGRVIDCGIGSGALTQALIKATNGLWSVDGVDISPKMLQSAETRLQAVADTIRLYLMQISDLSLPEDTFDLAISAHMLEHLTEPMRGLQAIVRVLKPGAPLLLLVTRQGLLGSYIRRRWQVQCYSADELIKLMTAAGLTNIRLIPLIGKFLPCYWSSLAVIAFKPDHGYIP